MSLPGLHLIPLSFAISCLLNISTGLEDRYDRSMKLLFGRKQGFQNLKHNVLRFRDKCFEKFETILILVYRVIPAMKFVTKAFVIIGPRPGRGLKESVSDSEFMQTIPKESSNSYEYLRYNSKFWILSSIKLLYLAKTRTNMKLLVIQYVPNFHKFPSINLLNSLQNQKVDITKVWLDSWSRELWEQRMLPVASLGSTNYIADIPANPLVSLDPNGQYIWNPNPILQIPTVHMTDRDVFLFYSGGISEEGLYRSRKEILEFLNVNGVQVSGTAYLRDNPKSRPSYAEYRDCLARAKVGLNFTWKQDVDIITGRTWEIFSSQVLLLQNKSSVLDGMFEDGVHYVSFESKEDLLAKIKFIEENPLIAESIAKAGHEKFLDLFGSNQFWPDFFMD